jgi:hypothetical protein
VFLKRVEMHLASRNSLFEQQVVKMVYLSPVMHIG